MKTVYVLESPLYSPSSDVEFDGYLWHATTPLELKWLLKWNDGEEVHPGLWTECTRTFKKITWAEVKKLPYDMRNDDYPHDFGEFLVQHSYDPMYEEALKEWQEELVS